LTFPKKDSIFNPSFFVVPRRWFETSDSETDFFETKSNEGSCMASPGICIWLNDESCDMHVMYYDVVPFCICRAGCMMDSFLFSDFPLDGQHCRLADD
jgi:hypothetical protein